MQTIQQQAEALADQVGVPVSTVMHAVEAVADRMARGLSLEEAVRDHAATVKRMAEDVIQGYEAWRENKHRERTGSTARIPVARRSRVSAAI